MKNGFSNKVADKRDGGHSIAHLRSSFGNDQAALLEALKEGSVAAGAELYDKYAGYVRIMLVRILGADDDLPDLINDVFYQIFKSVHSVKHSDRLKAWVAKTTVYVARGAIRKRKRKSWLVFRPSFDIYENTTDLELSEETIEVARAVRGIVGAMSVDDQLIFSLRFFSELEINELADALGVSKATVKRKLAKCESRFKEAALKHSLLSNMLDSSPKWRRR